MSSSDIPTCSRFVSSSRVNEKIVEYYLKYAKDRDIERFMRLSSSNPSKSGSSADSEHLIAVQRLDKGSEYYKPVHQEQAPTDHADAATQTPEKDVASNLPAPDSITKNDKRLEWDSLGDVGYKKASSTGNLSSLERSVLKELFTDSPSEPNISRQRSNEERVSSASANAQTRRERWRQTLENLGKKYSSVDSQLFMEQDRNKPELLSRAEKSPQTVLKEAPGQSSSNAKKDGTSSSSAEREHYEHPWESLGEKYSPLISSMDTQMFISQPQSTPKLPLPNSEKSCQTSFDKKRPQVKSTSRHKDHSCQTSFDQRASRRPPNAEKFCQTSIAKLKSQEVQANLSSRTGSFATQSSFEYHVGDSDSLKLSPRRSILTEKNSTTTSKSRPSSDSDKENQLTRKPNKHKTEVDLGIKLLCSLIDAKNLSSARKKNLAKKIFEKIMKQQSSASTSTSVTSRSSAFSVRSLIDDSPPVDEVEENRSESVLVAESKSIQQMSEETQTEGPDVYENPPTSSSSLEEPVTTREWLNPLTRSEKDYDKKHKKEATQAVSPQTSERSKQLSWIEMEISRLEGLKNLLIQERSPKSRSKSSRSTSSKSTIQSDGRAEVIIEESAEDVVNHKDQYKRTTRRTSQNVVIYDEPTPDDGKQPERVEYKTTRVIIDEEQRASNSGSLKNHRSKLETPVSSSSSSPECQSVSAFANQLQKQFMENYSKKERCVSEHYSEPRICGKPIFTRNPSYTSVASSGFCMSSEMSIPIVESSSTTTTTHQYDSHGCDSVEGVAVQTTYSVIKTDPIFGPRCRCICTCGKECKCSCPRPTVRVSGKVFHQTVQVKPKALAYVIRFTETCDSEGNRVTEECMTLQQRLEMQNPDFCFKANERREILKKLHKLRQEREQRIREIAETSNISSISRKLEQLPPPPIKHVRICPTREMKGMTKKRYCKLPEVVAKQEREKLERRKRTTRMITNIFNKKLQRMVHNGKLSLEYSRTVI